MKALSLWQPWATFIALGLKEYETRSWQLRHRGPMAIHAAKHADGDIAELCKLNEHFRTALQARGLNYDTLPRGVIICTVNVEECYGVSALHGKLSAMETAFGDYSQGRYAFKMNNIKPLPQPVPYRGAQGLFDWIEDAAGQMKLPEPDEPSLFSS